MAKYDAVDRLMAMAMEKRADRIPTAPHTDQEPSSGVASPVSSGAEPVPAEAVPAEAFRAGRSRRSGVSSALQPGPAPEVLPAGATVRPTTGDRGRQMLTAIRPFLPALAGALRLVDHGAVQAASRLLPLLGIASEPAPGPPPEVQAGTDRSLRELQGNQQQARKDLDALALQASAAEDQLRLLHAQFERLLAEHTLRADETRALADRVRLFTAAIIILLMLVMAQMILLVVLFHK